MLCGIGIVPFILLATAIPLIFTAVKHKTTLGHFFIIFLSVCAFSSSFIIKENTELKTATVYENKTVSVSGVSTDYNTSGSITLKNCTISDVQTKLKIKVYLPDYYEISPGDKISVSSVKINKSGNEKNVYYYHTISSGVYLSTSAYYKNTDITPAEDSGNYKIAVLRHKIFQKLSDNLTEDASRIATALITGDKSNFDDEFANNLRLSGISHIFAVSGMHLSLWCGVIFLLFGKRGKTRTIPLIIASLFTIFYMCLTGFTPSVLRSGIMLLLTFISVLVRRKADALNSLGFAATLLMLINPYIAGNISFLLSSFATTALVALYPAFYPGNKKTTKKIIKLKNKLRASVMLSLSVLFINIPLCAVFFGYISLLSPVSSLICTPLAEGIMLFSGLALIIPTNFFASATIFNICEILCRIIMDITSRLASFPLFVCRITNSYIIAWFIITMVVFLIIYFFVTKMKEVLYIFLAASSICLVLIGTVNQLITRDDVSVYIPSDSTTTAILLTDETESCALIIGAGGNYNTSGKISNELSENVIHNDITLVIPDSKAFESKAIKYISPLCDTNITIDSGTLNFFKNGKFEWNSDDNTSCGILTINGTKTVILFYDFSSDYLPPTGDILICRGTLPKNYTDYEMVYLLTNVVKTNDIFSSNVKTICDKDARFKIKYPGK